MTNYILAVGDRNYVQALSRQPKLQPQPKLGALLVGGGWVSRPELNELLDAQANPPAQGNAAPHRQMLGEATVSSGLINDRELQAVLSLQKTLASCASGDVFEAARTSAINPGAKVHPPGMRLGDLLLAAGLISKAALEKALAMQKQVDRRLGDVLVELKVISREVLDEFLAIQKRLLVTAVIVTVGVSAIGFVPEAQASGNTAQIQVRATVLKHTAVKSVSHPAAVTVTKADIDRGFVDVQSHSAIAIKTNSQEGYLLNFMSNVAGVRPVVTNMIGDAAQAHVSMSDAGVIVKIPVAGMTEVMHQLQWRLMLDRSVTPGQYDWPVNVQVNPI